MEGSWWGGARMLGEVGTWGPREGFGWGGGGCIFRIAVLRWRGSVVVCSLGGRGWKGWGAAGSGGGQSHAIIHHSSVLLFLTPADVSIKQGSVRVDCTHVG